MKANTSDTKHSCTYCNQHGHTSFSCFVKENEYFKKVIDNLLKAQAEPIGDLGLVEKIMRVFKK